MAKELYKLGDIVCLDAESCKIFGQNDLLNIIGSASGVILNVKKYVSWTSDYYIKFDAHFYDGRECILWLDERLITLCRDDAHDEDIVPEDIGMIMPN